MEFGAIGIFMLVIVLIYYLKMIDARAKTTRRNDQTQVILEKSAIFESVAKDADALTFIESALLDEPDNSALLAKKEELVKRMAEA